MIANARILIVEDDKMIALEMADAVADAGGVAIGPIHSVAKALDIIDCQPIDAAILDGNLADRDVTPVALKLVGKAVPMIVFSGIGLPVDLAIRQPDIPVILKPAAAEHVVLQLAALIGNRRA